MQLAMVEKNLEEKSKNGGLRNTVGTAFVYKGNLHMSFIDKIKAGKRESLNLFSFEKAFAF